MEYEWGSNSEALKNHAAAMPENNYFMLFREWKRLLYLNTDYIVSTNLSGSHNELSWQKRNFLRVFNFPIQSCVIALQHCRLRTCHWSFLLFVLQLLLDISKMAMNQVHFLASVLIQCQADQTLPRSSPMVTQLLNREDDSTKFLFDDLMFNLNDNGLVSSRKNSLLVNSAYMAFYAFNMIN